MITTFGPEWENITTNESRLENQQVNDENAEIIAHFIRDWPEAEQKHAIEMFAVGLWTITRSASVVQRCHKRQSNS